MHGSCGFSSEFRIRFAIQVPPCCYICQFVRVFYHIVESGYSSGFVNYSGDYQALGHHSDQEVQYAATAYKE